MKIKTAVLAASIAFITVAANAAVAGTATSGLVASPVAQATVGGLDYPYVDQSRPSMASRTAIRDAAIAQNATHPLAGEAGSDVAAARFGTSTPSTLTRAQVHAEVLAARANGTLPPAGDDIDYPESVATAPSGRFDAAAHPHLAAAGQWLRSLGHSGDAAAAGMGPTAMNTAGTTSR